MSNTLRTKNNSPPKDEDSPVKRKPKKRGRCVIESDESDDENTNDEKVIEES